MKSHREFVAEQCQGPEFARLYAKARQEVAFAVALARLREERGLTPKAPSERAGTRRPLIDRSNKVSVEFEQVRQRLNSRRTEDRIRAVGQAESLEPGQRQTLLLTALEDRSPYVAALAAEALREGADDRAAQAMTERFAFLGGDGVTRDPGCQIRAHLAFSLGSLQYRPAADALRAGIRTVQVEPVGGVPFDTAGHLRGNCALALAQLRDTDSVRDIALLLFDRAVPAGQAPDARLTMEPRKAAARALALTGSAQARLPLTLRLVHPENELPEVLQECMEALVALEDAHALEVLGPYLRHPDTHLAAFAGLMIARTQAPEAAALLGTAIDRLSGDPLRATVLALATLRTPEARALLHALTRADREPVRLAAIGALPSDSESRALLTRMAAQDPSPGVRAAAKAALPGA